MKNVLILAALVLGGCTQSSTAPSEPAKWHPHTALAFDICKYSPRLTEMYNEDGGKPMDVYMCVKSR